MFLRFFSFSYHLLHSLGAAQGRSADPRWEGGFIAQLTQQTQS